MILIQLSIWTQCIILECDSRMTIKMTATAMHLVIGTSNNVDISVFTDVQAQ